MKAEAARCKLSKDVSCLNERSRVSRFAGMQFGSFDYSWRSMPFSFFIPFCYDFAHLFVKFVGGRSVEIVVYPMNGNDKTLFFIHACFPDIHVSIGPIIRYLA
jgi:hypothetical protein